MTETVLYIKDNTGKLREWAIHFDGDDIVIRHGQVGGSMQYQTEFVAEGKAARSLEEQIDSRIQSRINKQLDKGYVYSANEAEMMARPTNQLGLPKPMLAHKLKDVKRINYEGAVAQPKFDGNRCLIYCEDGINKAYSRNGKPITAIRHILRDIQLEEGMILDGELYCHGKSLQTIVSWIKREQPDTALLKYHLYDVVIPGLAYKYRSQLIRTLPKGESISPVYGESVGSHEALLKAFRRFREQGYEGAILRWGDFGYEDGRRSKSLVKVKEWHDEEFTVVDIHESADGWAVLECMLPNSTTFRVSAPGGIYDKIRILECREDYIGREVTVEFADFTEAGKPFHPVAIRFREEV